MDGAGTGADDYKADKADEDSTNLYSPLSYKDSIWYKKFGISGDDIYIRDIVEHLQTLGDVSFDDIKSGRIQDNHEDPLIVCTLDHNGLIVRTLNDFRKEPTAAC